jgi:hypothetical protein
VFFADWNHNTIRPANRSSASCSLVDQGHFAKESACPHDLHRLVMDFQLTSPDFTTYIESLFSPSAKMTLPKLGAVARLVIICYRLAPSRGPRISDAKLAREIV